MADHDLEPSDSGTDRAGPFGEAATYERDGHVATITYNRPEALNAVNRDLRRDLNAAWDMFMADEEAWVAILTGAGDRAFCAGADLTDGGGSARPGTSAPLTTSRWLGRGCGTEATRRTSRATPTWGP